MAMEPMPTDKEKKACPIAAKIMAKILCSCRTASLGIKRNLSPSPALGSVNPFTARTSKIIMSPDIIILVILSTLFRRPRAQTNKPNTTIATAHPISRPGLPSIAPKDSPI
jgi:hypothetical protein